MVQNFPLQCACLLLGHAEQLLATCLFNPTPTSLLCFVAQASQGAVLQCQLGNLYTASLYSGLASLLSEQGQHLVGKRMLCFSFGSGVVASMFTLTGRDTTSNNSSNIAGACLQPQQQPQQPQQQSQQQGHGVWRSAPCSLQHMLDQVCNACGVAVVQ